MLVKIGKRSLSQIPFLILFFILSNTASSQVDLPTYISTLEHIRRHLEAGDIEKAKSFLPLPESLKIPAQKGKDKDDKDIVKLHNSELSLQLESLGRGGFLSRPATSNRTRSSRSTEVTKAIQRLDAIKKELEALSKIEAEHDLNRMQLALNEILSRDEFKYREPQSGFRSWLENLVERFFKWLSTGESREIPLPNQLLRWLALFIIVLVVNSIVKRLFLLFKSRILEAKNKTEFHQAAPFETPAQMSVESLVHQAHNFSNLGDYKRAIRYLYLSSLLYLDKMGWVRYDQAKTDGEYVKELYNANVNVNSQVWQTFLRFTLIFQRKWYGQEPCDERDFLSSKEIFSQLSAISRQ